MDDLTKVTQPLSPNAPDFQKGLIALIPFLRAYSRSLCRNPTLAEDMTQDALTKAWCHRNRFRAGTNLKAWLFTILRNEVFSHGRRAWRAVSWDETLGERIPSPAMEQEWTLELSDCARALSTLPRTQRDAMILVGAGGLTYKQASETCVTAMGTIKSRVARGRAALLDTLDVGSTAMPPRTAAGERTPADAILAQLAMLTAQGLLPDQVGRPPAIHVALQAAGAQAA
ncbi:MAG: sigma-70 family RNA polymerase sigma factor [Rhizomicrobium sp.]|jgi:RNA polymerase sigma-70 factor (ECF subfamily)